MSGLKRSLRKTHVLFALLIPAILSPEVAAQSVTREQTRQETVRERGSQITFERVTNTSIAQFDQRARRKWDSPVVADLDQDGYNDVIINEHTHFLRVYWGNGAGFRRRPDTIANGDLHGVSVGDFNSNGRMNIIVSQGGGRGTKPSKPLLLEVSRDRSVRNFGELNAFESSRGRALKLIDSDRDGQPDFIYTGAPVGSQAVDGANFLHINTAIGDNGRQTGNLISSPLRLPRTTHESITKTLVTDFDNDGIDDVIFYGFEGAAFARAERNGSVYVDRTRSVGPVGTDLSNVSGISEIDFDNDGDFDLVVTREASPLGVQVDYNGNNKVLSVFVRTGNPYEIDVDVGQRLELVNLQLSAPRFQRVYVGRNAILRELPRDTDTGSQLNISFVANDRTNGFPASKDIVRPGLYAGFIGNGKWRLAFVSRRLGAGASLEDENPLLASVSPVSTAIKNVRTRPARNTSRPFLRTIVLENRQGVFRDVTRRLGIAVTRETTGSAIGDFNNDGWMDMLLSQRGTGGATGFGSTLLLNRQGQRFERQKGNGTAVRDLGSTGRNSQTIDFDGDGDLDLIAANERGRWHLFRNVAGRENGNYAIINVGRSTINRRQSRPDRPLGQPHGATVSVTACGNQMVQRVGSGGSYYSTNGNTKLHFGLGGCDTISKLSVKWTDGSRTVRQNISANRVISVGEFIDS